MKKAIRHILEAIELLLVICGIVLEWGTIWAYIMCGYVVVALVYAFYIVIKEMNNGK